MRRGAGGLACAVTSQAWAGLGCSAPTTPVKPLPCLSILFFVCRRCSSRVGCQSDRPVILPPLPPVPSRTPPPSAGPRARGGGGGVRGGRERAALLHAKHHRRDSAAPHCVQHTGRWRCRRALSPGVELGCGPACKEQGFRVSGLSSAGWSVCLIPPAPSPFCPAALGHAAASGRGGQRAGPCRHSGHCSSCCGCQRSARGQRRQQPTGDQPWRQQRLRRLEPQQRRQRRLASRQGKRAELAGCRRGADASECLLNAGRGVSC